ncbi:MAG: aconitate hydratase AcnA [Anaerolineae bacterium]|nr:aconitate hydratase AcnA [Anaerolineae bacterium]
MTPTHAESKYAAARSTFDTGSGEATYYRIKLLEEMNVAAVSQLPFSIKVLLEAALRSYDGYVITDADIENIAKWDPQQGGKIEVPFKPARVVMQDFTGVPCVVDLAAMRNAMQKLGGDLNKVQPQIPVDLVIDHSVQVDRFGEPDALLYNAQVEFERNRERYEFLRWGQTAFQNFRVVPPQSGIVHQVNLEFLAKAVLLTNGVAFPDSLVGTDSHTTMINGLGVVGWGVGGIEAEAVMLGQPIYMLLPDVIGVKLTGKLPEGATATDLVLTLTQMLRKRGVVDKFVEFFGPGLSGMTLPDRATIANMAPEYGATMGFFPIDSETISYLRRTGRSEATAQLAENYAKMQGLYRTDETPDPIFTDMLALDLGSVEPSVAGPKRPQDRVRLADMKSNFHDTLTAPLDKRGFALKEEDLEKRAAVRNNGYNIEVGHGAVVIAAITSCTNTSNPSVMLGAGLLAKKAVEKGLKVAPYVKTSLAPGSRAVSEYLRAAGLQESLNALGFNVVGYGCTTCIGNSGPLPAQVAQAVQESNIVASAVLSGNRNFEGRINPLVKANYLASPPLVVAYALAGTTDIDFYNEPLGTGRDGEPVYLKDIWPSQEEIQSVMQYAANPDMYRKQYAEIGNFSKQWNEIQAQAGDTFAWQNDSTYVQNPPFFEGMSLTPAPLKDIVNARVLGLFGDSITTDHISPAGNIAEKSPAGQFLLEHGVKKEDFNQYGTRRGNDKVMLRGTFANVRLKNLMVPGVEGGVTKFQPSGEQMTIYDAAMRYKEQDTPLIVIAGLEYGTGSSRDWAAKGTYLLGVKAVLAESFERIHRSNLGMMGVLPLQFKEGTSAETLGLTGEEVISIEGISDELLPRQALTVRVVRPSGDEFTFEAVVRLDTPVEVDYYRNGGILHTVLRKMLAN